MIQLVLSTKLPSSSLLRQLCIMNPDQLLSLSVKPSCPAQEASEISDRFSLLLHDLRMGGAWKRTNRGRLRRTEEMLRTYLQPERDHTLVFLDVGASDGSTTIEALRALRAAFTGEIRCYLADINLFLYRYRRGPVVEYRASDGEPIMVRFGCLGVRLAKPRSRQVAGSDRLGTLYLRCSRFRRAMRPTAPIPLLNPVVKNEKAIYPIELDCLKENHELVNRVSAIRASNVLNHGYFDCTQIIQALGHFHTYLREGGCLVISRNTDEAHGESENGSVWRKEDGMFRHIADFGAGSDIKMLVSEIGRFTQV